MLLIKFCATNLHIYSWGNSRLAKGNTSVITNNLLVDPGFVTQANPQANNPNGTSPKAFMTIMFFDERFNFVSEGSTAVRIEEHAGDGAVLLVMPAVKSQKNEYAYISPAAFLRARINS